MTQINRDIPDVLVPSTVAAEIRPQLFVTDSVY